MKRNKPTNIIDLVQGQKEDGSMHFSFVGEKWRCAEFERRKAADDTKRIEVEQAGRDKL